MEYVQTKGLFIESGSSCARFQSTLRIIDLNQEFADIIVHINSKIYFSLLNNSQRSKHINTPSSAKAQLPCEWAGVRKEAAGKVKNNQQSTQQSNNFCLGRQNERKKCSKLARARQQQADVFPAASLLFRAFCPKRRINRKHQNLSDFCWDYQNLRNHLQRQQYITHMEPCHSSKHSNALTLPSNTPESSPQASKIQLQSAEGTELRSKEKQKRILRKPESILRKLRLENPLAFTHVHNVFNMMGINEQALRDGTYEESFFKTMFYLNTVERVELRKHALIIHLKPAEKSLQPIQYLIDRYKSYGDLKFYEIAACLERVAPKVTGQDFMQKLKKSFDGEPLSRFIDSMEGQTYMCKVAPNKLVISRRLLELLGEDPENYAVEMCKYKMPLREIISAESYGEVMRKSIQNIGSVVDFINAAITAEDLHARASIDFTDYILNRQNKKIYCNLILFMPTPQMSCIQVREVISETEDVKMRCQNFAKKRQMIEKQCEEIRYSEAEVLKKIVRVPEGLLKSNIQRLAEYRDISSFA